MRYGRRVAERGNVIFYVLIAVVLLAALSFAVAQSGRGNVKEISDNQARLLATELIEYSNTAGAAVSQLRLRGVKDSELCFDDPGWAIDYDHAGCAADDANKVFHISGAGVIWNEAVGEAMDSSATPDNLWHFYGDNEIQDVGTTCAAAGCADLLIVVDELSLAVCIKLNDLLGVNNPGAVPPTDLGLGETLYKGSFAYNNTIGDEAGGTDLKAKTAACFQKTGVPAEYIYYKVLIVR